MVIFYIQVFIPKLNVKHELYLFDLVFFYSRALIIS